MITGDGSLNFSMKDLYPAYTGTETSTEAIPDADDMEALTENEKDAKENGREARGRNIFFAVIVLIGLVIWFGGAK